MLKDILQRSLFFTNSYTFSAQLQISLQSFSK